MISTEKSLATNTKLTSYFLGFISFVLSVYILMALSEILIPVTIAIFLTFLFHPLVLYLKKFRIPQWLSLIFILIFVCIIYYVLGIIVVSAFSTFPQKLQSYSANLSGFLYQILAPFDLTLRDLVKILNIDVQSFDSDTIFQGLFEAGVIQYLFNSFSSILGDLFIALIFWVFMILGKTRFEERLKVAFADKREMVEKNIISVNTQLQSYIVIKTIISLLTGIFTTVILLAFGIDFAVVWGLLTFVLNFIPNIGSLIATIAPIIIAFLEYGFGFTTLSLSALLLINQNIMGNIIEPHYMGRHMDLSPVFVLFSLIFWGWVWGIVGMFLAVPIAAAIKILFSNIEPLKPLAVLIGSKTEPDIESDINGNGSGKIIIKKPLE